MVIRDYPAVGGPKTPYVDSNGNRAGPTDPGTFRVAYYGKHRSSRKYSDWSSVRWGTPLKKEKDQLFVQVNGSWDELSKHSPVTEADIVEYYEDLYGTRRLPSAWVFNDFGHLTIFLYEDLNNDGQQDAKTEKARQEFIHTTPVDEAFTTLSKKVTLGESHGCVHVRPSDIDEMVRSGFIRKNTLVIVHQYGENIIRFPRGSHASRPSELHFYPGIRRVVVVGTAS